MPSRTWLVVGAVLIAWSSALGAQERVLEGRMVAAGSGRPVSNAAVRPVGGGPGSCTREDGSFAVVIPAGDAWLELAVPGWVGRVPVSATASEVRLELDPRVVPIAPLVVTAGGEQKMREGASRAELRPASGGNTATDMRSLLQGRIPGATVIAGSGATGSGFRLLLRGLSSIVGSNEPLVVIDGVVTAGGATTSPSAGGRATGLASLVQTASPGGLQDLSPDDVERIEVLRGPAASALYGSLGMHGVVLVTTRHGRLARSVPDDGSRPRCPGWPKP